MCTDCDGTLTYEAGKVSKENVEAIRYFQEEGGLFTLATGRSPAFAKEFADMVDFNAPLITLGGTVLYDFYADKIIKEWTASRENAFLVFDHVRKNWGDVLQYWLNYDENNSVGYNPHEHQAGDNSLRELFDTLPERMNKMLIFQPSDVTPFVQKDLKERFGDKFRFDTSWSEGIEVQSIKSGKGIAVDYMKKHLGKNIHTTIGVGDYENDINLLECADIGYAVGNAIDSVKAVADRVTVKNTEHALKAIIEDIERDIDEGNTNK